MSNAVKYYLGAYNLIAFIFWAAYLFAFITGGLEVNHPALILLNIAQGLAVLEVIHALLKWVKSPVVSTVVQVASRLFVVVLINIFSTMANPVYADILKPGVIMVSFAWGATELIRYSLYLLSLFNKQPHWLIWCRYSFFIVLYPLGVIGEWLIITYPLQCGGIIIVGYNYILMGLFIGYAIGFPVLYKYMWKQRKAKLN